MLFLPKLRILKILIAPLTNLHRKLEPFLQLDPVHQVLVLPIPFFDLIDEIDIGFIDIIGIDLRDDLLILLMNKLEHSMN